MSASKGWIPRLKLIGGALCLDIANTTGLRLEPDGEEALRDYEDLVAWAEHAGALDEKERRSLLRAAEAEPKKVAAVHRRAIVLREAIYSIFSAVAARRAPEPGDVDLLNEAVAEAYRHLCLVPTASGFTWEWRGVEGALELPLWKVARSAADLLVSPELERVRECAGEKCDWLFLDASRNQSRRWCDMAACGNRAKARRNYERRRGGSAAGPAIRRTGKGRGA
jgi:predicted RNA-binding Zn ribbon-like protein